MTCTLSLCAGKQEVVGSTVARWEGRRSNKVGLGSRRGREGTRRAETEKSLNFKLTLFIVRRKVTSSTW